MNPKKLGFVVAASLVACAHQTARQKSKVESSPPVPSVTALSWYRLPASDYSVLMPAGARPGEKDRTIPQGEVKVYFAQAMPQGAAGNYFVSCAQFPPGALDGEAATALLDEVQKSTLQ